LALAARCSLRCPLGSHTEPVQIFVEPRLEAPAFALVRDLLDLAPYAQAVSQRGRLGKLGFLFDQCDLQAVHHRELAIVEREPARKHFEQRRLSRAIATDEADALVALDRQLSAIEQRMQSKGKLGVAEGEKRHYLEL